jgi:hypothetical protein
MTSSLDDVVFTDHYAEYDHMRARYKSRPSDRISMSRFRRDHEYEEAFQSDHEDSISSPLSDVDIEMGDLHKIEQPEWYIILHQVRNDMQKIRTSRTLI